MADSQTIGKGAYILTTQAGQMAAGLNQAQKQLSGFIANVGGGLSVMASGPVGYAIAGFTALKSTVVDGVFAFADSAASMKATSDAIGIGVESYTGLAHGAALAGLENEAFAGSLAKLSKNVANATLGNKTAQETFAQLGLSMDDVKGQGIEAVLGKVADKLGTIEDANVRAKIASDLFGRQAGPGMAAMLSQGSAGLQEAIEHSRELGLVVTEEGATALDNMGDAYDDVKGAMKGTFGTIATVLAGPIEAIGHGITNAIVAMRPIIEFAANVGAAFADVFSELWEMGKEAFAGISESFGPVEEVFAGVQIWMEEIGFSFDSMKDFALSAIEVTAKGLSYLVDAGKMVAGGLITFLVRPIVGGFHDLMDTITAVIELMGKLPGVVGETFQSAAEGMAGFTASVKGAEDALAATGESLLSTKFGDASKSVDAMFDRIKAKNSQVKEEVKEDKITPKVDVDPAIEELTKFEDELKKQLRDFGKTADEIKLTDFAEKGATEDQLAAARGLIAQKDALEESKKLADEGLKIQEANQTPFEEFEKEMTNLNKLLDAGVIDWETYSRAAVSANEDIAKSVEGAEIKAPEALLAGSQEAARAVIQHRIGGFQESKENVMQRTLSEQKQIQQKQYEIAQQTFRLLKDRQTVEAI